MAIIIDPAYWALFGSIYTVWVWILPAIPIQLAFISAYAFIINKIRRHKRQKEKN